MTGQDLAIEVLRELDVIGGTDAPDYADVSYCLSKLNRIVDSWRADWGPAYVNTISSFTITPSLQPHTIGPTGATWTLAQRPVSIEAANVVSGTTRTPLDIWGDEQWMSLTDPTITAEDPSALNYRPTHPNGSIYFYPVPTSADTIEILSRGVLATLTLAGTAVLPPGYQDALILTGAEACAKHFHAAPPNPLEATKARARIATANAKTPRLITDVPSSGGAGSGFDIRTGTVPGGWVDPGI